MPDGDIQTLHHIGSEGLLPDLTLLLEAPVAVVSERLARRDQGLSDRIGGRSAAYHAKVGAAFAGMAAAEPHRFARVSTAADLAAVHAAIMAALAPQLPPAP